LTLDQEEPGEPNTVFSCKHTYFLKARMFSWFSRKKETTSAKKIFLQPGQHLLTDVSNGAGTERYSPEQFVLNQFP